MKKIEGKTWSEATRPDSFASPIEIKIWETLLTFEKVLGRKATRTRPMFDRHGIIETVNRLVSTKKAKPGFEALAKSGQIDRTFEAIVVGNREVFSPIAFTRSKERIDQFLSTQS